MHGIGNDYVYVNLTEEEVQRPAELARKISDRHFGIGADGLVLIDRSEKADLSMRMFNADGSESEMCGNAIRCVAKYGYEHGLVQTTHVSVDTLAGLRELEVQLDDWGRVDSVRVNMGIPELSANRIPSTFGSDPMIDTPIEIEGQTFLATLVNMGNPHFVTFVDDLDRIDVKTWGPRIEGSSLFPNRINVEFVEVLSPTHARQRTWERGSGETAACGTGASATLVAGLLTGRLEKHSTIELIGGKLQIAWEGRNHPLFMTGPAVEVFQGTLEITTP